MPSKRIFNRVYAAIIAVNALLIAAFVPVALGWFYPFHEVNRQIDFASEGNFAVWFSSAQLMLAGLAALTIALVVPPGRISLRMHRIIWLGVVAVMMGLSADETSQFHEWAGEKADRVLGEHNRIGHALGLRDIYMWLLMFSPLIIGGAAWLVYTGVRSLSRNRFSMWLSFLAMFFWCMVIGAEYVEAIFFRWDSGNDRGIQSIIEEGSEIIGAALFLIAFLDFLRTQLGNHDKEIIRDRAIPQW